MLSAMSFGSESSTELAVAVDDPRAEDVQALLRAHHDFVNALSPPEDVHALDLEGLLDARVTFFSARHDGVLVAIGALQELDSRHAEVKSMHTVAARRGQGAGRAMVLALLAHARARGYERVSLETGALEGFEAARALYAGLGFEDCPPFAAYVPSRHSTFMTIRLDR
jgi:putative acetyltransferase